MAYQINKRLVKRGHKVFQITCKSSENQVSQEIIDGIHYHRVPLRASKNMFSLWSVVRKKVKIILNSGPVHLIHIHNPLIGFVVLLLPGLWNVPKVYHFHSSWFDEERINAGAGKKTSWDLNLRLQVIRVIEWACYKFSATILFLSEYSKNRFKEYFPFSKSNHVIISGGVDLNEFRPLKPDEDLVEIRGRINLKQNMPILLTVRRLEERMGLENLVLAVEMLAKKFPDKSFQLVIAGKGSLRRKLENLVAEKDLSGVIKLSGLVSQEDLPLYFRAADLFVLPTTAIEGFGLATAEAFASGLPVMGTPVGATKEILALVDKNLIFEGISPQFMANGLERFFFDPQYFSQLKSRVRETAEKKFSWEKAVDLTEKEFIKIINETKS